MDDPNEEEDELIPPDVRRPQRLLDSRRQADGELSDSDDEGTGGRRNHASHKERSSAGRASENGIGGAGRKFGMGVGVGIMSSGAASTHAGPSGHTTAARILSTGSGGRPEQDKMDVDTPSSGGEELAAATPTNGVPPVPKTETESDAMPVDVPAEVLPSATV